MRDGGHGSLPYGKPLVSNPVDTFKELIPLDSRRVPEAIDEVSAGSTTSSTTFVCTDEARNSNEPLDRYASPSDHGEQRIATGRTAIHGFEIDPAGGGANARFDKLEMTRVIEMEPRQHGLGRETAV